MSPMTYSPAGLALTKSSEGDELKAYQDSGGVWTIGEGHTGTDVHAGEVESQSQADAELEEDLQVAIRCVNQAVRVTVTQGQFDAMVDFAFNAGTRNFRTSTLLRKVNVGDFAGAAEQFGLWVHAGGEVVDGLVRRRAAEAAMFVGK